MNEQAIRFLAGMLPLLMLTSCAVGPDFKPPQVEVPQEWSTAASKEAPVDEWWKLFNDPVLLSLIERADKANLTLAEAQARVLQARADVIAVRAPLFPSISAIGEFQRSRTGGEAFSAESPSGTPIAVSRSGRAEPQSLFRTGFDASWELDLFGGNRRALEAARADLRAFQEAYLNTLVSLRGETATNYIILRGLQAQLDVTRNNLAVQKKNADIVIRRYNAGFASRLELANAEAEVAATAAQIPLLQASIRRQIFILSVLLAQPPAALEQELTPAAALPAVPAEIVLGLPADLARRRPDIRQAEADLHAATAQVGVAVADLFPKLSLSGLVTLRGSTFDALGEWSNRLWSFAAGGSQAVFQGGRLAAAVKSREAAREQALLRYRAAVLDALREVETALADLKAEEERAAALQEAAAKNQEALNHATRLYSSGLADFLEVLTAERSLYNTELSLAISRQNALNALISVYKALGGPPLPAVE